MSPARTILSDLRQRPSKPRTLAVIAIIGDLHDADRYGMFGDNGLVVLLIGAR